METIGSRQEASGEEVNPAVHGGYFLPHHSDTTITVRPDDRLDSPEMHVKHLHLDNAAGSVRPADLALLPDEEARPVDPSHRANGAQSSA